LLAFTKGPPFCLSTTLFRVKRGQNGTIRIHRSCSHQLLLLDQFGC
jgi:hypothetical protein